MLASALAAFTRHVRVADAVEPRHRADDRRNAADDRHAMQKARDDRDSEHADRLVGLAVHELPDAGNERTADRGDHAASTTGRLTHQCLGHSATSRTTLTHPA